tara:strand:- start:692 stop:1168 length:477 start_codon:yes stop_codon:yes gene_type:complete
MSFREVATYALQKTGMAVKAIEALNDETLAAMTGLPLLHQPVQGFSISTMTFKNGHDIPVRMKQPLRLDNLEKSDEVIIKRPKIIVELSLGLTSPRKVLLTSNEWTRKSFLKAVFKEYERAFSNGKDSKWIRKLSSIYVYGVYFDADKNTYCLEADIH